MLRVVAEIADDGEFMELHADWARNIVCALTRIGGQTVGIVANQPLVRAGVLDIEASGFGRGSYPIEIGFVLPDGNGASMIRLLNTCSR